MVFRFLSDINIWKLVSFLNATIVELNRDNLINPIATLNDVQCVEDNA